MTSPTIQIASVSHEEADALSEATDLAHAGAEAANTHTETGTADHGPDGGVGLPQLDPVGSLFVSQLFWLGICFGFLYLMMSRIALPRIATVIEERKDKIALDLDRAAEFRGKIDTAIAAYEKALSEARSRAHRTVDETRKRASADMEQKRKASEAQIMARLKEAEDRINTTKDAALQNVRDVAVDVATNIVGRLSGDQVPATAVESAVDAEFGNMPSR
jgi:F-type H+-transporting ATPase subunit b